MKREPGRPRIMPSSTNITIQVSDDDLDALDRDSMARGESRAAWVRDAIDMKLRRLARQGKGK